MKKILAKSILLAMVVTLAACSATPVRRSMKESWNDTLTAEKIRYKLMKDKEVKKSRMHVEVFRGQVTLTGRAVSEAEKARAEQVVKSVKRVTAVENYIHVVGDGKAAAVIEEKTIIVEKEKITISEDDMPAVTTARIGTGSGQSATTIAAPSRKSAKPAVKDTKLATVKKTPVAAKPAVATAAPVKKAPIASVKTATVKESADAAVPMSSVPATKVVGKSKTGLPWDGEVYEDDASSIKSTATASRLPEKPTPVVAPAKTAAPAPVTPPPTDDLATEAAQELEKLRQKR